MKKRSRSNLELELAHFVRQLNVLIFQTCSQYHVGMKIHGNGDGIPGSAVLKKGIKQSRIDIAAFLLKANHWRSAQSNSRAARPSRRYISNLNTFSALMDRLVIENIKLYHLRTGTLVGEESGIKERINGVAEIIDLLQTELIGTLREIIACAEYKYAEEKRTYEKQ